MRRKIIYLVMMICVMLVCGGCSTSRCEVCNEILNTYQNDGKKICSDCKVIAIDIYEGEGYTEEDNAVSSSGKDNTHDKSNFTNKYGTPTTYCAHSGCDKYIANSGDTNCCILHSKKCIECYCYIDEDALYCMNCIEKEVKYDYTPSQSNFTNKYGTAITYCAHSGCNNYIASSGDTNCCSTHSQRCLECNCYIDEDALFCMSCMEKALGF